MAKKQRLDIALVERELAETRSRARGVIMAGDVFVNGARVDKAGHPVSDDDQIEVRDDRLKYVSRGGLKLEAALQAFRYDCSDRVVIDVGASTGGFTDCVLAHGASRVYAVDVGYGQLSWRLREDPRVVVMERTNIRHLAADAIPQQCDLAVIDCSFISLRLVLPNTLTFLKPGGDLIVLVKPQFEAGREGIGKGGVVKDDETRQAAIDEALDAARDLALEVVDGIDCPIHGPAGNVEYLAWLRRSVDVDVVPGVVDG